MSAHRRGLAHRTPLPAGQWPKHICRDDGGATFHARRFRSPAAAPAQSGQGLLRLVGFPMLAATTCSVITNVVESRCGRARRPCASTPRRWRRGRRGPEQPIPGTVHDIGAVVARGGLPHHEEHRPGQPAAGAGARRSSSRRQRLPEGPSGRQAPRERAEFRRVVKHGESWHGPRPVCNLGELAAASPVPQRDQRSSRYPATTNCPWPIPVPLLRNANTWIEPSAGILTTWPTTKASEEAPEGRGKVPWGCARTR